MGLLELKQPVPSDIEIAQTVPPVHIAEIARKLGIAEEDYDLYGTHKAKVHVFFRLVFNKIKYFSRVKFQY